MNKPAQTFNGKRAPSRSAGKHWARRTHRLVAVASLVFLALLAITGIAMNHADDFGLHRKLVSIEQVHRWYSIEGVTSEYGYPTSYGTVALAGDALTLDDTVVTNGIASLKGAVDAPATIIAATLNSLILMTQAGELIETVYLADIIGGDIDRIGLVGGRLALDSGGHVVTIDTDLIRLVPGAPDAGDTVTWSLPRALTEIEKGQLGRASVAQALSWNRVLTDIHSGRIVPGLGRWLMDIAAIALLYLSLTGLFMWFRSRRRSG